MEWTDIGQIILIIVAVIAMIFVLRARKRSQARFLADYAENEICPHLRSAYETLISRGHKIRRAGQKAPELPVEIHLSPPFNPAEIAKELNLQPPVKVSERNVLFCEEDACEIHPVEW